MQDKIFRFYTNLKHLQSPARSMFNLKIVLVGHPLFKIYLMRNRNKKFDVQTYFAWIYTGQKMWNFKGKRNFEFI